MPLPCQLYCGIMPIFVAASCQLNCGVVSTYFQCGIIADLSLYWRPCHSHTPMGSCCLDKQYETKTCLFDIASSLPTCGTMPRSHSCGVLLLILEQSTCGAMPLGLYCSLLSSSCSVLCTLVQLKSSCDFHAGFEDPFLILLIE